MELTPDSTTVCSTCHLDRSECFQMLDAPLGSDAFNFAVHLVRHCNDRSLKGCLAAALDYLSRSLRGPFVAVDPGHPGGSWSPHRALHAAEGYLQTGRWPVKRA